MSNRLLSLPVLIIALLLGVQALPAQESGRTYDDRLYLRDGSILKGQLLHIVRGESYWFELSTGDTLVYPAGKVKRLIQDHSELSGLAASVVRKRKPYAFREHGPYFSAMASLGLGRDFSGSSTGNVGLAASAGYLFQRWLGVGGGIGMDIYQPEDGQVVYPVFAEARGYLTEANRAPYYALRLGYGVTFADAQNGLTDSEGGILVHPALGMRWGAARDVNFVTDIGFQYQKASFTFERFNGETTQRQGFKRLLLRLGIVF